MLGKFVEQADAARRYDIIDGRAIQDDHQRHCCREPHDLGTLIMRRMSPFNGPMSKASLQRRNATPKG